MKNVKAAFDGRIVANRLLTKDFKKADLLDAYEKGKEKYIIALFGAMGQGIHEKILDNLINDTGEFTFTGKTSKGGKRGLGIETDTRIIMIADWVFGGPDAPGAGVWFEKAFFNLDRNSSQYADIQTKNVEIEIKTKTHGELFEKCQRLALESKGVLTKELAKAYHRAGTRTTNLKVGEITDHEWANRFLDIIDSVKVTPSGKISNQDKQKIIDAFVIVGKNKFEEKMQSLLLVERKHYKDISRSRKNKKKLNKMMIVKMLLYYGLVMEAVAKILVESITIIVQDNKVSVKSDMMTTPTRDDHKVVVTTQMKYIGNYMTQEHWANSPDQIYKYRVNLFENLVEAKKYFELLRRFMDDTGNRDFINRTGREMQESVKTRENRK